MQEQRITFQTAKLAKEKGFNLECDFSYIENGRLIQNSQPLANPFLREKCFTAPTQHYLKLWLSKNYELDVEVVIYVRPYYCVTLINKQNEILPVFNPVPFLSGRENAAAFETYEEAFELGLKTALNMLT